TLTLMALGLGLFPWTARTSALGQEAGPPAASDPDAKREKRIEDLDQAIDRHVEAGQIGEAVPTARGKRRPLVRLRGKDHWQTGDARRDVETYLRIASLPRDVQEKCAEARRGAAQAGLLYGKSEYARASELLRKSLAIDREVLGEGHPGTANSYADL